MREPNIKELMESLAEEDFLEIIFQRNRDASEEVAQLMYFLRREQAATLYNEISELEVGKKQKVFSSLVKLYPLSQDIVKHLVIKREKAPVDFLRVYDQDRELLASIRETIRDIKENSHASSSVYNQYQREIEKVTEEINQLEDSLKKLGESMSGLKEKLEERARLEGEIKRMEDYQQGNLEGDIESLKLEIESRRKKQREQEGKKERMKKELDELAGALSRNDSDPVFQDALSALKNCIKSIPRER